MKKAYYKAFEHIKEFLGKDKLDSEPIAMNYMNSAIKSLLQSAKAISEETNTPLEEVNTMSILKSYFSLSTSISASLKSAFDNYVKYDINSDNISNREREALKKDIQKDLASFLVTLKDFLTSCGALNHLKIQHNQKMGLLNLSKLAVTQEQINEEFDYTKNTHLMIPTLITKCAFWANKAVKYIEHLKVSILLFEKDNLPYTQESYDALTDKDKITAIYKEKILTKLRNDICDQLPEDFSFNSLLILYSAVLEFQRNPESTRVPEGIENLPNIDNNLAESLLRQLNDFHTEYDKVFAPDKNVSSFSKDVYSIGNNFSLEDDLYNHKNTLMILLGLELRKQHTLASPYIKHFGISPDRNAQGKLLNIDLPNYFMPASFHYDRNILASESFAPVLKNLPNYEGFFSSSKNPISTYVLCTPSEEQKKYIKEEFRKIKFQPDSTRTKLLSQMNGMANGRWQEFDALINKDKTK